MPRRFLVPSIVVFLLVLAGLAGPLVAPIGAQVSECSGGLVPSADGMTCVAAGDNGSAGDSGGDSDGGSTTGEDVTDGNVTSPDDAGGGATGPDAGAGAGSIGGSGSGAPAGDPTVGSGTTAPSTGGGGAPTGGAPSGGVPDGGDQTAPVGGGTGFIESPTDATSGGAGAGFDPGIVQDTIVDAVVEAAADPAPADVATGGGAALQTTAASAAYTAEAPPDGAIEALVVSVVDGDTIRVRITQTDHEDRGKSRTINLIGIDAPETIAADDPAPCFGSEATRRIKRMLPKERIVWLEQDITDRDGRGRMPRYVWFEGQRDGLTYLANELLVREGFAVAATLPPDDTLADLLADAQDAATADLRGLWAACDVDALAAAPSPEAQASPEPEAAEPEPEPETEPAASDEPAPVASTIAGPVKNCMPFATYEEAQAYYADHPEAQPNIDPDVDGLACESRFYGGDPP